MPTTTIGISLGTRNIGIAVMRGRNLIDWQIKTYTGGFTPYKITVITSSLLRLIKEQKAAIVVLKLPNNSQSATSVQKLTHRLLALLSKQKIKVHVYHLADIKKHLCGAVKNKRGLCRWVLNLYPSELRHVYKKHCDSKSLYYLKLFEAVAISHIHIHKK